MRFARFVSVPFQFFARHSSLAQRFASARYLAIALFVLAAACGFVAFAFLVIGEVLAEPPGPQLGAEGLAVPPGKEFEKELFHAALMPSAQRNVQ